MSDGQPDPPSPPTHHKPDEPASKRTFLDRFDKRSVFFSSLITFVVTLAGAVAFADKMIERTVEKRLAPYELLSAGLNLNRGEDWNEAISTFRIAIAAADSMRISKESHNQLYDGLLYALSNSPSPIDFRPELERIRSRIGAGVAENAWRNTQLGWYFLRIGRSDTAKTYLQRARDLHNRAQEWSAGADAAVGLVFVALAEGDPNTAVLMAQEAADRNPRNNSLQFLRLEVSNWTRERWYMEYEGLYGERFTNASKEFSRRINELVTQ